MIKKDFVFLLKNSQYTLSPSHNQAQ